MMWFWCFVLTGVFAATAACPDLHQGGGETTVKGGGIELGKGRNKATDFVGTAFIGVGEPYEESIGLLAIFRSQCVVIGNLQTSCLDLLV